MFRSRVFSASNIAIVIAAAILGIQLLGLSLFLQQSWHWPTISTGLALAPGPAAVLGASLIAPRLHQRFPTGAVVYGVVAVDPQRRGPGHVPDLQAVAAGGAAAELLLMLLIDQHRGVDVG
jgi:hypothetical protein